MTGAGQQIDIKTAVLIANPTAGKASDEKLKAVRIALEAEGYSVQIMLTEKRGDAEEFANKALANCPDLFVIAGGDGTINEAINGLAGSNAVMAIVPLGTANVLAKELGLPNSAGGAIKKAIKSKARQISIGLICAKDQKRYFCIMAGAGFDAEAVYRVSGKLKKLTGKLAYIISGISVALGGRKTLLKVTVDEVEKTCNHVVVSNGRKYAGNYTIAPNTSMEKPGFEVTLINGAGLSMALFSLALILGVHKGLGFVDTIMGQEVSIEGEAHTQIDGDYFGLTPARITTHVDMLRLMG